jgi:hypothetical protein
VAAPADNGTVTLATALGNFSFSLSQIPEAVRQQLIQQLDVLFQSQKQITAVVQPGSPPSQAVLLLPSAAGGAQPSPLPAAGTSPAQALPQILTLSPGTSLPAVVLPPNIVVPGAAAVTATAATPAATAAETPLQTAATATQAATATSTPSDVAASNPTVTAPTVAPVAGAPVAQNGAAPLPTASPAAVLLQPGKEVIMRIDAVTLPSAPPPVPANPNQIAATVIGNGANGQLILKAGDAALYVRSSVEAPVGTHVLATLEATKPVNPAVLPSAEASVFSSLQQTLDALAAINPQLAQQVMDTHILQPNLQLAGPLLFFLSALKQGDAKGWLGGDAADALMKGGKMELLAKLARDMGTMPQTERDASVGEWKSYPVPLQINGQFQTLTLRVHADGRGTAQAEAANAAPHQVRFLIDVRMSRLGPMQLDGLVRPKKLDMIVRSESALPPGLPQDLRGTYLNTLEALGLTGSLSFQNGRQNWLVPRKQTPQSVVT